MTPALSSLLLRRRRIASTPSAPTPRAISPAIASLLFRRRKPAPSPLPIDLLDAIEAYLQGLLVPGTLTWVGAGLAPPGQKMPYAAVGDPDVEADWQEDGSGHPPFDDEGDLPIRVIASSRSACKALLATIDLQYPAGLNLAPLAAADGQVQMIRRTSKGLPILEDEDAPIGQQAWVGHLIFRTIQSKTL